MRRPGVRIPSRPPSFKKGNASGYVHPFFFPFGGVKRLDVVAEFFNLFNSANVFQINPVFGSGLTAIPGFRQPIAGTGARQVQFSLDFEF